jgi:pimeloyl-ACP methyl ester carboxylesterase
MEEKTVQMNDIAVNYKITDEGQPILILHGWGSSSDAWSTILELLAQHGFQTIIPDLPGFGKTQPPQLVWGVEEYARFVEQFANSLGLRKFVLLGHSFGGQTAAQFAAQHPEKIEKLILFAPAIVRKSPGPKEFMLKYFAKLIGLLLYAVPFEDLRNNIRNALYMVIRRRDYVKTQGIMREIFQKVIRQDVSAVCLNITAPTLLIWGDKDKATPIGEAYAIKRKIPGSFLTIVAGQGHNLHFVLPDQFVSYITNFCYSKK